MGSYAYKYCMCFTRKFRSPDAQPPPDVRAAHHSISASDHGLRRFLSEVQAESPADVQRILAMLTTPGGIARLVTRSSAPSPPTLDDFFGFLFSPDLNPPIGNQVLTHLSCLLNLITTTYQHDAFIPQYCSLCWKCIDSASSQACYYFLVLPTIAILLL
jgi:phosphatidylinositol phospholipase C, delta